MGLPAEVLTQALDHHKKKRFDEASRLYNALLNSNPFDETLLFLLGDLYLRKNQTGLAVNLLSSLLQFNPNHAEAWCNLGIGYRQEDRFEPAIECWKKALELQGDTVEVCSNMAGLYADRCQPNEALHWIDRALAIDPNMIEAHWQRGLVLLTLRKWAEGWDEYEYRLKLDTVDTRESLGLPYWNWQPTEHLYIHGEQGIGDEVMFLSCLDEVLPLAKRVTLELNQAVAGLAQFNWPKVNVITEPRPGDYTAKIALGSLAAKFRRSENAFPGIPYLTPNPSRVKHYRKQLEAMGPGPYLALTWFGGHKRTRIEDRSVRIGALKSIMDKYTCVSGQYEHTNPFLGKDREEAGLAKLDDECLGKDIHAQAALFKAVDAVVTVQQTAVHVAGAVGTKALVMVNKTPHWRYGREGNLPWYDSVQLIRQQEQGDWAPVIQQVENELAHYEGIRRTQPADARAA